MFVMNMIIDDGIKEKIQRKNIFNKEFNYIGIGAGKIDTSYHFKYFYFLPLIKFMKYV